MIRDKKGKPRKTHGHSRPNTPTYTSWINMRDRCYNAKNISFRNYGGRGIQVCCRWFRFENFLEDMGLRPDGHTIDRINSNGHYMPSNCRWSTPKEQASHRRSNGVPRKLDWEKVCEIRRLVNAGILGSDIAIRFSVSKSLIHKIKKGKVWKFPR